MTSPLRFALLFVVLAGCEATGIGTSNSAGVRGAESGTKRGSAGGFSARLAKELGPPEGSLGAAAPGAEFSESAAGSGAVAGGSGVAEAKPAAGSGAAASEAAAGSGTDTAAGSGTAESVAEAPDTAAGASDTEDKDAAGESSAPAQDVVPVAPPPAIKGRAYVKPPPELAAIKLDLEPNWERDVGEAGTFSLVLKVPNTSETRVFSVRYGYEDDDAPVDCDQYRKFLVEKNKMEPTLNRQRSGTCYIESKNAFRYLVVYGGKRLLCEGSLYKDAASLGDLRDKVLMQAKKICETLAL